MNSPDDLSRKRAKLERCPPGHNGRAVALTSLAKALYDRFRREAAVADLEEAITLERVTLELRPSGHPGRGDSLNNLACGLLGRFHIYATMSDLEEAIELFREALLLRPPGHPDRPSSLCNLASCLSTRYDNRRVVTDLEESVMLGQVMLKLRPPGHPDRGMSLNSLACSLMKRFQKHAVIRDLEEAIKLHREALGLHPSGHPNRSTSLHNLALCLSNRYDHQGTVADLEEAAELGRAALQLRPPGHPDRGISLRHLACDLRRGFRKHAEMRDLDEAIELHRATLELHPSGHPDRSSSLHNLSICLLDRYDNQRVVADLEEAVTFGCAALALCPPNHPDHEANLGLVERTVKEVIHSVILTTLTAMPTRLLHTHSGILCDRDAQVSYFTRSQQYSQLLSSCTTCNPDQRMELIHTHVLKYFQYAMFSHRWGEGEPLLYDIDGQSIYDLSTKGGFGKLQAFCCTAYERDYLWAWSDTCCIDKDSSAEFQEAIGSMFVWYRQSALTIAYLSDISGTGSLGNSEWFSRGWTLQELLAPPIVLFYTENWSPYKNLTSSNHKTDVTVLEELERATGIDPQFLTNFSPGLENARSRLQWASLRRTTLPEDMAYSLFGIFNLYLPVLYGEYADGALGRLLAEIITRSRDISVLDWVGEASSFNSCFPAHVASYQSLPLPPPQLNAEELTSKINQQPVPSSTALQTLYRSLAELPLPRFLSRRIVLPCIAHRVTAIQLKTTDTDASSYSYEMQASGLKPLEITLPSELENATISRGILQLVRPWNSQLLGPPTKPYATAEEQLLSKLGKSFNALLLIELPSNQYKRIASSTLIAAHPVDSASVLQSEVKVLEIV
ncbi:hypothetical protein EDC04DRAFT_1200983 [Pisolithus marmoratus]|nr:hypothetical protein EDC04DRAFT_1200983 [Pisolithus marmoratus]